MTLAPALRRAVALAMVWLAGPAAAAEQFRDWSVLAPEAGGCLLHQRVIAAEAGLAIADVFAQPTDAGGLRLSVQVPVGASLADGMAYRHTGQARAVPLLWQRCDGESCLAQVEVDARERGRLMRAVRVDVAFVPVPGARPLTFRLSLLGLTAALGSGTCRGED